VTKKGYVVYSSQAMIALVSTAKHNAGVILFRV